MLIDAAKENNLEELEKLSQQENFDSDVNDSSGKTALMWAALYGHKDFVKSLINNGANLHLKDNNKLNALHFAAKKGIALLVRRF
jgi:ankyrin repeat protein